MSRIESGDKPPHSRTLSRPIEPCFDAKRFGARRLVAALGSRVDALGHHLPAAPVALRKTATRPRRRRGFTLLEILLTIGLIALIGTVLIGGAGHLLTDQPVTTHDVFWKAVQEARKIALKNEKEVRLRFDEREKQFVLLDALAPPVLAADGFTKQEVALKTFPLPPQYARDLTVDFLSSQKGGNLIMIRGVALETQPIKFVTFYPDGTCTAFRAQFARPSGAHILAVDPWTCAPMLTTPDPNAPPVF